MRNFCLVARVMTAASGSKLPPAAAVITLAISARARITVRTLESLGFGEKHPKKRVRFAYKSFKLWGNHPKSSSVPGNKRNEDTRLGGLHGAHCTGSPTPAPRAQARTCPLARRLVAASSARARLPLPPLPLLGHHPKNETTACFLLFLAQYSRCW